MNHGNTYDVPPSMPVKRKRGRPRKDQSLNRTEGSLLPPGFGGFNGNQTLKVDAIEDTTDSIVGQAVTGVVEAAFDAGYLLSVKIGNSNASLRGVVFKPGHYVPISAENDVAPHVQMIRRNEIPLPMGNQTRIHGRHPRSRERNEQHSNVHGIETGYLLNGSPPANQGNRHAPHTADLVASKGKHASQVSAYGLPSVGSRGTVVPVVLQPVSIPNGLPAANQVPPIPSQTGHMVTLKHKQVQPVTSQMPPSQHRTNHPHPVTPEGVQNENGPFRGTAEVLYGEEDKSMKSTGVSTPDEVNKRAHVSSQSSETAGTEGDSDDTDEPLVVEPLQAIHSGIHNRPGFGPKPSDYSRIGRMSELLQVKWNLALSFLDSLLWSWKFIDTNAEN